MTPLRSSEFFLVSINLFIYLLMLSSIRLNLMSESTILCIDFFWRSYVGNFYNERLGSGRFLLHQEMAGLKGRKFCLSGMLRIVSQLH